MLQKSTARIPTSALNKVNVFNEEIEDFEKKIYNSLTETKNVFANNAMAITGIAASVEPHASVIVSVLRLIVENLGDSSDWRECFTHALASELDKRIAKEVANDLIAKATTAQGKLPLLLKTDSSQNEKEYTAGDLHTLLLEMVNKIEPSTSIFKKYPMMAGPVIESLSLLVVNFEPLVRVISPVVAVTPSLSCDFRNVLKEYVSLLNQERIFSICKEHTHCPLRAYEIFISVLNLPYNNASYLESPRLSFKRNCARNGKVKEDCVSQVIKDLGDRREASTALLEYASFLRERVEHIFPIEYVEYFCDKCHSHTCTTTKPREILFYWSYTSIRY